MSQQRGLIVYHTTAHVARCKDCPWGRGITSDTVERRKVNNANTAAANHARRNGHRVVVEISRVFDRRQSA